MQKPVLDLANELLQLLAGGVDEQGSRLAEYHPLDPQLRADGSRGPQRAGEAQHPGRAEDDFLLLGWHGGRQSPPKDAALSEAATRSSSQSTQPSSLQEPSPRRASAAGRHEARVSRRMLSSSASYPSPSVRLQLARWCAHISWAAARFAGCFGASSVSLDKEGLG